MPGVFCSWSGERRSKHAMRHLRTAVPLILLIALGAGLLTACQHKRDPGDPVKISRDFIVATWTGDTKRVKTLSCPDTEWNITGDPTLTVDAEHLRFEIVTQTEDRVEVEMSGTVTFKSASGQVEVRNLDDLGHTRFVLEEHQGWKVCDVR